MSCFILLFLSLVFFISNETYCSKLKLLQQQIKIHYCNL
uniref:Uncharacterized protein n=1 Tax=Anguilla anguilla TaxID=7936 RepID=A0A0E9VHM3_ANGAN